MEQVKVEEKEAKRRGGKEREMTERGESRIHHKIF